jgi:hypothetical protein
MPVTTKNVHSCISTLKVKSVIVRGMIEVFAGMVRFADIVMSDVYFAAAT